MSLLFLDEEQKSIPVPEETYKDLALDEVIEAITSNEEDKQIVKGVFTSIPTSVKTIQYRQEILSDFIQNEEMCNGLEKILSKIKVLQEYGHSFQIGGIEKASIWDLLDFLQELEVYVEVIEKLGAIFKDKNFSSKALQTMVEKIDRIIAEGGISHIKEDIAQLRTDVSITKSLCLGINLSPDLYPEEVKILSFSNTRYKVDYRRGSELAYGTNYYGMEAIMKCMTREVEKILAVCIKKMKKVFRQYVEMDDQFFSKLYPELQYYLLVTRFYRTLQHEGHTVCLPDISESAKEIHMSAVYNIRLAIQKNKNIVKNNFGFLKQERLFVLTGPNRGGKTVLTQGIGLAVHMASIGLYTPAVQYSGFQIYQILTHFPADENKTVNYGRLGEEAIRIRQIIKEADRNTLLLLNETYATTCASDGLFLAKDLLHVLKRKNVLTLFNTHIRDLPRGLEEMNAWEGESNIVSIIMEIENNENTFKVKRSEPDSSSYAQNIARKYGITYEQMIEE